MACTGKKSLTRPVVGMTVQYSPPSPQGVKKALAAIIAYVHSNHCVNLAVFMENGEAQREPTTSVLFVQEDSLPPNGGGWCRPVPTVTAESEVHEAARRGFTSSEKV